MVSHLGALWAALALLGSVSVATSEVQSLEAAGDMLPTPQELDFAAASDVDPGLPGTGRFTDTPNFPGPKYGEAGYNPSHNWEGENDVDLLSPLIFDVKAYKLHYLDGLSAASWTEADFEQSWLDSLSTLKYPNCRQGTKHAHAPGGFSLVDYFGANPSLVGSLGDRPTCGDIATHFLTQGVYQGLALGGGTVLENDLTDDAVKSGQLPVESWLMCKWTKGAVDQEGLDPTDYFTKMLNDNGDLKPEQVYSRAINPWDFADTRTEGVAAEFRTKEHFTVSFWMRTRSCYDGSVLQIGDPDDGSPFMDVRIGSCLMDGVRLEAEVPLTDNKVSVCKAEVPAAVVFADPSNPMPASEQQAGLMAFNKWYYVSISASQDGSGAAQVKILMDGGDSQLQKTIEDPNGDHAIPTPTVVNTCLEPDADINTGSNGHVVMSSFIPDSHHTKAGASDVAGVTYYAGVFADEDVKKLYDYEQAGVKQWTPEDAKTSNNGVC